MSFSVVNDTPKLIWLPVAVGETLYVGQLVKNINEGAINVNPALGIEGDTFRRSEEGFDFDGTSSAINNTIFGVVVGTNARVPSFNSTLNTEQIAYVSPNSAAITTDTYVGPGGPWAHGDNIAMVKIAILDATTVLRGSLVASAATAGTAPTVLTVTASSSGLQMAHAATGSTNLASHGTIYFRSGVATGQYRVCDVNKSTCTQWDLPLTLSTSGTSFVGDTFVHVALRSVGPAIAQIGTLGLWIDSTYNSSSDNFGIIVHRMDLSEPGGEYIDFTFTPAHFCITTGSTT